VPRSIWRYPKGRDATGLLKSPYENAHQALARFGDELETHLRVIRKGVRSLTYGFEISRRGETLANGRSTCACCVMDDPAGIKAIPIPRAITERIEEARHREGD
jgi:acyl-CoA thioesterase FadM